METLGEQALLPERLPGTTPNACLALKHQEAQPGWNLRPSKQKSTLLSVPSFPNNVNTFLPFNLYRMQSFDRSLNRLTPHLMLGLTVIGHQCNKSSEYTSGDPPCSYAFLPATFLIRSKTSEVKEL